MSLQSAVAPIQIGFHPWCEVKRLGASEGHLDGSAGMFADSRPQLVQNGESTWVAQVIVLPGASRRKGRRL